MRVSARRFVPSGAGLVLALLVAAALLEARPLLACPEEIVTYGPFVTRRLSGRIVGVDGEDLPPGLTIHFVVREKGPERSRTWTVPVRPNGSFALRLPEGLYEFNIKVEGFLFTVVGDVRITRAATARQITLRPPWC